MGVIQTNLWLKEEFESPMKICEKLIPYFKGENSNGIYNQLLKFGMYRPSRASRRNLDQMIEQDAWDKVEDIFQRYRTKWSGPDVPIFLFPLAHSGGFFLRQESTKSGVSYPDKMFLFLSGFDDPKELEALFVHEYHHVCRIRKQHKEMSEYTLLDSIIIEGLAEYAVLKNCGKEYLAKWCKMYSDSELSFLWKHYLHKHLGKRKNERGHDELLYGGGRFPKLLGYAAGYYIVANFFKSNRYTTKLSFSLPSSKFIEEDEI